MGLNKQNEIPKSGHLYILLRDKVVYKKYNTEIESVESWLKENEKSLDDLLEFHAFNGAQEYRVIKKENGEEIETVVKDDENGDFYDEKINVLSKYAADDGETAGEVITVRNYIEYDKNDMIRINNYRLMEVD